MQEDAADIAGRLKKGSKPKTKAAQPALVQRINDDDLWQAVAAKVDDAEFVDSPVSKKRKTGDQEGGKKKKKKAA